MNKQKQIAILSSEIKSHTVADILRSRWETYSETHEVREVEEKEVEKTLACRSGERGIFIYRCLNCGKQVYQTLGCNSRMCSCCGKRYTDQWATSLSKSMFDVPHRQFVISVPPLLWPCLKENRSFWKDYMDAAIETCNDYFPKIMRNPRIKPGCIVILHPFGKDLKFQPHLHVIVTEGGFDGNKFVPKEFFPARKFAKCWQYHVSKNLQEAGLPAELFTGLYRKYDGFYVWVHRAGKIEDPKDVAKYLGRYVRHPAIANSRIIDFDQNTVRFYYEEYRNWETTRHEVTMQIDEFISALIQHIPDKQFKMIRYYGVYGRKCKGKYKVQSSITSVVQESLYMFGWKCKPICPYCGGLLEIVGYERIPPPEDYLHWKPEAESLVAWRIRN